MSFLYEEQKIIYYYQTSPTSVYLLVLEQRVSVSWWLGSKCEWGGQFGKCCPTARYSYWPACYQSKINKFIEKGWISNCFYSWFTGPGDFIITAVKKVYLAMCFGYLISPRYIFTVYVDQHLIKHAYIMYCPNWHYWHDGFWAF